MIKFGELYLNSITKYSKNLKKYWKEKQRDSFWNTRLIPKWQILN